MIRLAVGIVVAAVLGAGAVHWVRFDTSVGDLFGTGQNSAQALDGFAGRSQTIAILGGDVSQRSAAATELAKSLEDHPLVKRTDLGPRAPDPVLLDWLWQHRLQLSPPTSADLSTAALGDELERSRRQLTSISGGGLAPKYLLDPTGSYRRLLEAIGTAGNDVLEVKRGVWQSRDGKAAIVLLLLRDLPFDAAMQSGLDRDIRSLVEARGLEAVLIGPRSISAEINARIAVRAETAALLGSLLVLIWIGWVMRKPLLVLICVLPALIGFGAGILGLQALFGSVHLLAIGFGGVLVGLAIDYPLHLILHGRDAAGRTRAWSLVRTGAITTAVAFLAMLASDIQILIQTGIFVATGLCVAAAASWAIGPGSLPPARRLPALGRPLMHRKLELVAGLVCLGGLGVALLPDRNATSLIDVPVDIRHDISSMDRMMDLPSGQYRIDVTATTLTGLLEQQRQLANDLQELRSTGHLGHFRMLSDYFPVPPADLAKLDGQTLSGLLPAALERAQLSHGFADKIVESYTHALNQPLVDAAVISAVGLQNFAGGLVQVRGDRLIGAIQLWDVRDADAFRAIHTRLRAQNAAFIDEKDRLRSGLTRLKDRALFTVGLGALAGMLILLAALRRSRAVIEIILCSSAATLIAAAVAGAVAGGLGVFHLVALALVIGIGIDYGLFLATSRDETQDDAAIQSVLVCAVTTLLAFIVMVFSGVQLLEDIGLTVTVGVGVAVAVSVLLDAKGRPS